LARIGPSQSIKEQKRMNSHTLSKGLMAALVALLAACGGGGGGGGAAAPADTTAPTVSSTSPAINATGVATNADITATFSEAMATGSGATFTLSSSAGTVTGVVSYSGATATFNPNADLAFSTLYTATLTTGVTDAAGNALAANHVWTFTTGAAPDTTAPTVSSTSPATGVTDVAVNANITATFSENMAAGSISDTTFTLSSGAGAVAGAVSYSGTTAMFNPNADLAFNTTYTATLTTGVTDAAGNPLAANHVWTFTTGAAPDITAPTVSSVSPANNAIDVTTNSNITASFSENMTAASFSNTTFTLSSGAGTVTGAVSYNGTTATFNPSVNLAFSTLYTATLTTGVTDAAGNPLATNYTWNFTTGAAPDTTAPTVSSTNPASNATNVAVNGDLTATFSENMTAGSFGATTFTLSSNAGSVSGPVTYSGTTATFNPNANLAFSTLYTATLTTGVTDAAGNPLATNYVWTFTTAAAPDITAPTVSAVSPPNGATNVVISSDISATFSESMALASITAANFTLSGGAGNVTGTVSYNGTTATFNPNDSLAFNTTYTATITTGVTDAAGNPLAVNYTWSFTTPLAGQNDTGVTATQCYGAGSDVLIACSSPSGTAGALNEAQDGMRGRDANTATNSNTDGKLGFSFSAVPGGCVTDNVTGLMWEVKTDDGGLRDKDNTYTNEVAGGSASTFVTNVNSAGLCGFNDWRLPTADELQSIVDYGTSRPAIDATWFPNAIGGYHWSSSPYVDPAYAWSGEFNVGSFAFSLRTAGFNVRLVRGNALPARSFTISANGQEVTDESTGLIWRRCAEGMNWNGSTCAGAALGYTHEAALVFANTQSVVGGWRLPNVKELASLVNKSLIGPAIDTTAFPATPSSYLWSASPYPFASNYAWSVNFGFGNTGGALRTSSFHVRLVRAGQ
jgi:Protein of unknown function (DUF1566)/Bacterial Ig-like domain